MSYRVHIETLPGGRRQKFHSMIEGQKAEIMEAVVGQRGWLWINLSDDPDIPYHRLHTSEIQSVEKEGLDKVVITTLNTKYILTEIPS